MRGKKAKQLRALTREHTTGNPGRAYQPVTTHAVRYEAVRPHPLTGAMVKQTLLGEIVNPIRLEQFCMRRQYQLNKSFYERLRRGDEAIYA